MRGGYLGFNAKNIKEGWRLPGCADSSAIIRCLRLILLSLVLPTLFYNFCVRLSMFLQLFCPSVLHLSWRGVLWGWLLGGGDVRGRSLNFLCKYNTARSGAHCHPVWSGLAVPRSTFGRGAAVPSSLPRCCACRIRRQSWFSESHWGVRVGRGLMRDERWVCI